MERIVPKIMYHYVETLHKLFNIVDYNHIRPIAFQTTRIFGPCPHVLVSANPECEYTTKAIIDNVYEPQYSCEDEIHLFRLEIRPTKDVMPWPEFKKYYSLTHIDLIEEEQEMFGDTLNQHLWVSLKLISFYRWGIIEELQNEKWVEVDWAKLYRQYENRL